MNIGFYEIFVCLFIVAMVIGVLAVGFKSLALAFRYWWVSIPIFGAWYGGVLGFFIGVAIIAVLQIGIFLLNLPFKLISSFNDNEAQGATVTTKQLRK